MLLMDVYRKLYRWNELSDSEKEKLRKLKSLFLDNNQLRELPESIGELKSLEYLFLDNNKFSELPESIGELKSLEYLFLNNNQLRELPKSIGELKSLERLFLNNNQLSVLSESIEELSSLKELWMYGNQFSEIPPYLGSIRGLNILRYRNFNDNSIENAKKVFNEYIRRTIFDTKWFLSYDEGFKNAIRTVCALINCDSVLWLLPNEMLLLLFDSLLVEYQYTHHSSTNSSLWQKINYCCIS